ncbi:HAMP domain-containing sensor histidine kinase [Paucibacter sp. DJ1R-11]|uniref:sensor histidine kinase n=1 Tax=Paucibacter sp. DJ1R-11 TaxID=2893556 RepID=UPI00296218DB|nr:HAMP domain-containing sensor histidine kinase [Paucibacter sp. DJ1R-11]
MSLLRRLPRVADMPRLPLLAFRNRIVFHGVFLLLALATLLLAVTLLREEKERAYQRYAQGFEHQLQALAARLRHPSGQLALLNPQAEAEDGQTPLLLPFSTIDFDDPAKTRSAVEMSGCARDQGEGRSLCLALGSNAFAGGFVYAIGSLPAGPLQGRQPGQLLLDEVHRVRIGVQWRGQNQQWLAPFEAQSGGRFQQRGRLTGFEVPPGETQLRPARPDRDFRGWLWREGPCLADAAPSNADDCPRQTLFSLRVPVAELQQALAAPRELVWPPADLSQLRLHIELLGPQGAELFDNQAGPAHSPLTLGGLGRELQRGELLRISQQGRSVAELRGAASEPLDTLPSPWLTRLIRRLPLSQTPPPPLAEAEVLTPLGRYQLRLSGDWRSVDQALSAVATRVSWLVGAMLGAIFLAWAIITLGLMRRIARLTKRAAAVSYNMQPARIDERIGELDVADLRGRDELGILAGTLADLLSRAKLALRREQLRAEHEHDMWHAVGHEIMSPLQSLLALHPREDDPKRRYLLRMQQAVRVLYGTASPSEALAAAALNPQALDLAAFVQLIAENAADAGIAAVQLTPWQAGALPVDADEHALEDVIAHLLRNADRHRHPGTAIRMTLEQANGMAQLHVDNQGEAIPAALFDRIFDYGVSSATEGAEHRGQGLFVARSYLARMDGRIVASHLPDGVRFSISLPLRTVT